MIFVVFEIFFGILHLGYTLVTAGPAAARAEWRREP